MVGIIDLIFDKALAEPISGQMYSTLCARCAESFPEFPDDTKPGAKPHTFKRLLLNKCQEEFEKENVVARELLALPENTPKEKKDFIRSQAKKRMLGNIRFIGELYKQKMLTEKIMHECLIKLLGDIEHPDEDEVECLCKLMTTVGSLIDHERAKSHMDEYFNRMTLMSNNADLATRMRFMLQEIIDLRHGGWRQRVADPTAVPAPSVAQVPAAIPAAAPAPAPATAAVPAPVTTPAPAPLSCSATPTNASTLSPRTVGDEDDDWETKDEAELIIQESPKPSAKTAPSVRLDGAPAFASAGKEPAGGKKVYPRDFLMRFERHFVEKPPGLTCDLDVIVGEGAAPGKGKGAAGAGDEWLRPGKGSRGRGVGAPPGLNGANFSGDPRDPRNNQFQKGGGGGRGAGRPIRGGAFLEVKPLEQSDNRYVAASVSKKDVDAAEKLLRDCKAILNKIAPEKFEKLVVQFLELQVASRADMVGIIDLIFDKALAEPISGQMYSTLCARCAESFPEFPDDTKPGAKPHTFKRLLLNKCQEEFEKENVVARELLALPENTPKEKKDFIRSQAKKRMLGNIRFIGELYKQKMLTEKIMHECLIKLLGDIEHPDEDEVECLCKLMTTVGSLIDHERAKSHMDEYFNRMTLMSNNADLATRMRFMLQEIIDLRRGGWRQRVSDPTVKVAAAPPVQGSGRPRVGAGDVRKEMQAAGRNSARGGAWGKGGGSGPPEGRGRGGAGPSAPPVPPPMRKEEIEKKLERELEEYLEVGDAKELVTGLKELRDQARLGKGDDSVGLMLVRLALPKVIEARTDAPRKRLAASVGAMHKAALLSPADLICCLKEYLELIEDEVVDIWNIGTLVAGFIAQAIADAVLPLSFLSSAFSHLKDSTTESVSELQMVLAVLKHLGEEKARELYLAASDFDLVALCGAKEAAAELLESAGLAGLDPSLVKEVSAEKQAGHLAALNVKCDELIQSIKKHVEGVITSNRETAEPPARQCASWVLESLASEAGAQPRVKKQVMRNILRCVFENAALNAEGQVSSKNLEVELGRWRPLFLLQHTENRDYVHSPEEQAGMLFEVQGFCHDKGFPENLIKRLFLLMYQRDFIVEDAFTIWRETDPEAEPTPGKTKALFQANEFLEWLATADQDDEEEDADEEA